MNHLRMQGPHRPSRDGARRRARAGCGTGIRRGPRAAWKALADGSNDRGAAVQAAVLFPFLIILTFAIIQAGIWFYARSAALNAAEEGLQAARAENGSSAAAVAASSSFLQRAASGSVLYPATQVSTSPLTITVTVSGDASSIVDFLPLPRISQTVTGATERFTTN
jgi:Flp pilus assembly protein TadG